MPESCFPVEMVAILALFRILLDGEGHDESTDDPCDRERNWRLLDLIPWAYGSAGAAFPECVCVTVFVLLI